MKQDYTTFDVLIAALMGANLGSAETYSGVIFWVGLLLLTAIPRSAWDRGVEWLLRRGSQ